MLTREFLNRDGTLYQRVSVMKVVVKYSEALGHLHVTLRAERFNASGLQVGPSAQVCSWEFRSFAYQQRVFASLGWGDHGQKLPWEENINPSSQRNACPHCTFATNQNQWALLQIHINECHPKNGVGKKIMCKSCNTNTKALCKTCCWKCRRSGKLFNCPLCLSIQGALLSSDQAHAVQERTPRSAPQGSTAVASVRRRVCPVCKEKPTIFCKTCCRECKKARAKRDGCQESGFQLLPSLKFKLESQKRA